MRKFVHVLIFSILLTTSAESVLASTNSLLWTTATASDPVHGTQTVGIQLTDDPATIVSSSLILGAGQAAGVAARGTASVGASSIANGLAYSAISPVPGPGGTGTGYADARFGDGMTLSWAGHEGESVLLTFAINTSVSATALTGSFNSNPAQVSVLNSLSVGGAFYRQSGTFDTTGNDLTTDITGATTNGAPNVLTVEVRLGEILGIGMQSATQSEATGGYEYIDGFSEAQDFASGAAAYVGIGWGGIQSITDLDGNLIQFAFAGGASPSFFGLSADTIMISSDSGIDYTLSYALPEIQASLPEPTAFLLASGVIFLPLCRRSRRGKQNGSSPALERGTEQLVDAHRNT